MENKLEIIDVTTGEIMAVLKKSEAKQPPIDKNLLHTFSFKCGN